MRRAPHQGCPKIRPRNTVQTSRGGGVRVEKAEDQKPSENVAGSDRRPPAATTHPLAGRATLIEPAQFRMVVISLIGAGIGLIAGGIAFALYKIIGLLTNIAFYG